MAYTDINSEDRLVQATFAEHLRLCHESGDSPTALASDCLACRRSDLAGFS
jgi:hypothetical protein